MLDKYFNKIEKELNRVFDIETKWSHLGTPYQIGDFPIPPKNNDQPNFDYTYTTTYTIDSDLKANLIQQADIYISETGDYRINVLVAGYDKKDIKVFTDEKDPTILTVVFESVKKKNIKYIQQQIPKGPRHLQFRIDTQKYDIENTTGAVRDGILYLSIPKLKNSKKVNLTF